MILAIVGSRDLTDKQFDTAEDLITGLSHIYNEPKLVSGGAEGVDRLAQRIWHESKMPYWVYYPRADSWESYKERNILIATECDVLWSIRSAQSKTYGSGWTADYAEKLGKEVHRVVLP